MVAGFRSKSSCLSLLGLRLIARKFTPMENTYTIIWVTESGDRFGAGQKRFSKAEAEKLAMELNQSHPGFVHEAINTATADPREAIAALKKSLIEQEEMAPTAVPTVHSSAQETLSALWTNSDDKLIDLSALFPFRKAVAAQ